MLRIRTCLISTLLMSGVLWGAQGLASEVPQFYLQVQSAKTSGYVRDGTLIARGRIVYYGLHDGFRVWSDAWVSGSQPNRYILTGQQNRQNTLRIRLEKEGVQTQGAGENGLVLHTTDENAVFDILTDGEQTVASDSYPIKLNAAVLLPQ